MLLNISAQHRTSVTFFAAFRLYCEVDASYLFQPDSKAHTGYNISFYGTIGTFHKRSVKQTAVATSSTHAEAHAIFTLAKELNFLIVLCQELQIPLELLPAIIMEDSSAVYTMANNDSEYTKKCKHFLMVLNYIKEQIVLGQIEARKIYGNKAKHCGYALCAPRNSFQWLTKSSATRQRNRLYHLSVPLLLCRRKQCLVSWKRM